MCTSMCHAETDIQAASVLHQQCLEALGSVNYALPEGFDEQSEAMYLGHVAFIVKCAQVVEQLQGSHEGLRCRWIHEVKMHLQV